jgi:hypothetical protein
MTAHRRGVTVTGGRGGGSGERSAPDSGGREAGGAREAVGMRRLYWDGDARGEAAVGRARSAWRGRDARSQQRLKPRCRHGTWRPRSSGALPPGSGTARDG